MLKIAVIYMSLKIANYKLHIYLPGANYYNAILHEQMFTDTAIF